MLRAVSVALALAVATLVAAPAEADEPADANPLVSEKQPGDSIDGAVDNARKADSLLNEGNQLGAAGKFEEAIEKFRAADALFPRAVHSCNIGLAYVRLSLWAPAHYYLSKCKARWSEGTLPAWVSTRIAESERALAAGNFAKVMIITQPPAAVTVSPFPGEALFGDELWLQLGTHAVTASADGFEPASRQLLVASRARQRLEIVLEPKKEVADTGDGSTTDGTAANGSTGTTTGTTTGPASSAETSTGAIAGTTPVDVGADDGNGAPWLYAGIGSGVAAAGLVALAFVFRAKATDAANASQLRANYPVMLSDGGLAIYNGYVGDVSRNNSLMTTCFVTSALATTASAFFLIKWRTSERSGARVSADIDRDSASVYTSWQF